ncbi:MULTISPECIES: glycosyltransferase family 2 protein [unclassified Sphingomonas]|uniref:glycosyltransferase family 2 protein n=1 Tax=unclassified Sphingomonas TaxID=196159 RepID=UPI000700E2D9|nr:MULTISPECIES: glycosyltransferase family A protein [unclassified Sphingomonas]KQM23864.1 family 2 glycosyl transferase [Sphingomonas sp. Leaf9]KQM41992.1 family 2 glycosyl transferase [Sphingomonas sp. Leaf11]KQM81845.1 family 2 glycosyl transferase [Sphingomonas sp. Leaf23]
MQHVPPRLASYDVVIPCHNRAHVVADAIDSVLAQDHAPCRVIVVDDGSSDASATVIRALAAAHDRVEAVILPRNVGASQARNSGVALATAEWVAFLDSDDVWLPGAARALLAPSATAGHDIVVGHFARIEGDAAPGAPECGWDGGCIGAGLMSGGVIGPSWSVVRRQMVERVQGFDPSFHNCNDWDFYTRAAAAGARFVRLETCVACYRTVAGSRLVNDTAIGERNARRVLAHPYFDPWRDRAAISA